MKILIVTFTGGVNPGTIMQAIGVQTAFKQLYPNAHIEFLDFPDFKRGKLSVRGKIDSLWHSFLQKAFAAFLLIKYNKLRKTYFNYSPRVDMFNYDKASIAFIKQYDLVVIGSDTILEQGYNLDGTKIGLNWMPLFVPKLYFAASASPATFNPSIDLKEVVEKALFIGLRDNLTVQFFINKLGIEANRLVKQPDPSYYLDITKFILPQRLKNKIDSKKKYALYNFNSDFPYREKMADNLRSLGYQVISTAYNPYADMCFDTVDAFEWAAVFPYMDIIVTERFHDSVFGLRNCRPVVAIDWDKNRFAAEGDSKTFRILEDYGHQHLHFNLCGSADLTTICTTVENITHLFDLKKIKEVNNIQTEFANKILIVLKDILLRNNLL